MPPKDSPIYRNLQSITSFFQNMLDKSLDIVLYKPPVGAVVLALGLRLVLTGRIFQLERPETDVREQIFKQQARSSSFVGKALDLDTDDANYRRLGGIDATRKRLCEAAWTKTSRGETSSGDRAAIGSMEQTLLEALQVTHKPSGTRADFLQRLIEPLAQVESLLSSSSSPEDNRVLVISELTLQIQAMDALLRLCRNRLLQTVYRLARAKEYWDRRINESRWWHVGNNDVENRLRLAQAQAAYQAEVKRLGRIMEVLFQRPNDMEEGLLLQALKTTEEERLAAQNSGGNENDNDNNPLSSLMPPWIDQQRIRRWHPREWKFPKLYSLHWRGGRWYVQKNERATNDVSPSVAREALTETSDEWMTEAREWTQQSRKLVVEIVRECLEGCSSQDLYTVEAWDSLAWASQHYGEGDTQKDWSTVLHYVNALSTWRRIGESKVVRLKDAAIVHWSRRMDIMGIPSYLASIWIANRFHNWIMPRWPQLKRDGAEILETVISIWIARVWVPFKGIVDELMNRSKGIMSALSVEDEQTSLDHMLRDMGFGDGTSESRRIALQRASEQYEHDLSSGVFVNLARGRLVRLLLIQVQQLKVGLLSAMGK